LLIGLLCWILHQRRFRNRPSGLAFLMIAIVGIYSFLGPLAGAAFGGDFHTAFTFLDIRRPVSYLASATGFILLPSFMFYMGRELLRWAPSQFGRAKVVACTTLAPWVVGTLLLLPVYWPLPSFLSRVDARRVCVLGLCRLGSNTWLPYKRNWRSNIFLHAVGHYPYRCCASYGQVTREWDASVPLRLATSW